MSEALQFVPVVCPYCGEAIEMLVELTIGDQAYIEDCSVCCQPIECRTLVAGGKATIELSRDDE